MPSTPLNDTKGVVRRLGGAVLVVVVALFVLAGGRELVLHPSPPADVTTGPSPTGPGARPLPATGEAVAEQALRDGVDLEAVPHAVAERVEATAAGAQVAAARDLPVPGSPGAVAPVPPVGTNATVGPERPVAEAAPDPVPATTAIVPAVAFDGTNYLVVWSDGRDTSAFRQIYAARVTRDGTVLDRSGILLSGTVFSAPAVAFDGTNFLVVWAQGAGEAPGTYANRVSRSGVALDGTGFLIAAQVNVSDPVRVTFDGTNYLAVWTAWLGDASAIFGKRIRPDGTVVDAEPIVISVGDPLVGAPALAFDGSNHLVVWNTSGYPYEDADVLGARVSTEGAVLDPAGIAIATGPDPQYRPAIAFDGTNYLVVWSSGYVDSSSHIAGARVSTTGSVLDPGEFAVTTEPAQDTSPSLVFDGANHLVLWIGMDGVTGSRVSPAGTVLDPGTGLSFLGYYRFDAPGVAFDGTNHLVVSAGSNFGEGVVTGLRVTRELEPVEPNEPYPFVVSTTANGQTEPVVGFDGTNYLVVWEDDRVRPGGDVFGARVRRDGTILDGSGFRIGSGVDPAIAFDGTNFLVVVAAGDDLRDISAHRVRPDGVVLDPGGIFIGDFDLYNPAVTFDGENFVVAYRKFLEYCGCPGVASAVEAVLVSPDGVIVREGTRIAGDVSWDARPALASDGTNTLVVWDHGSPEASDIHATRVSGSLEVLDGPTGVPVSAAEGDQSEPAVAFDGTKYLVVWSDDRNDSDPYSNSDIYGARVGRSGVVRDPDGIPISTATGDQRDPSVASTGRFFVVWRDERDTPYRTDVYGSRVSGAGAVLEPDGVPIATSDYAEAAPAVIAGPGGRYTVVYQRYTPEAPFGSERTYLRRIAPK